MRPRRLNPAERAVLETIIRRNTPQISVPLLRQVQRAEVIGSCGCGCPTVYLDVDRMDGDAVVLPTLLLETEEIRYVDVATGELGGGVHVTVDEDGYLEGLEFWPLHEPLTAPPPVGALRFFPPLD